MLSKEELRSLSQVSGSRTLIAMALDWLGIIAIFAVLLRFPHPITYLLGFILIGRQQLALAILMHDGAHGRLFKSTTLNDYLGQFFTAAPLLFSQDSYRKFHLKHHLSPLVPDDPDISLIGGYPIARRSFYRKLLRDIFGVSYFKFIGYFLYQPRRKKSSTPKVNTQVKRLPLWVTVLSILTVNGIFFGALVALGHPWLYFLFWLLPMMTVLQLLLRIRGIAEHAGYQPHPEQMRCSRTVVNPVQTFFFAPHQVNYHMEHHEYPSVPFFNLPRVHRLLRERGSLPAENLFTSYRQVLRELVPG